jgi:hypothetical protein
MQFKARRSQWALRVNAKNSTQVLTTGRSCPGGENGLAGHNAAAAAEVFLAGGSHRWRVDHVQGDCSLVNLVDAVSARTAASRTCVAARVVVKPMHSPSWLQPPPLLQTRAAAGAPAFLSTLSDCAQKRPVLVSRDYGTGRQRWRLVKLR